MKSLLLKILNPVNWGKALSFLSTVWSLFKKLRDLYFKHQQEKKLKEFEEARRALDESNQIADDEERLKAKAEAVKRLEDLMRSDRGK